MNITVTTHEKDEIVDITPFVEKSLPKENGVCVVFVRHTTAAVTVMDLDPGTDKDLLDFIRALVPTMDFRHPHDPKHAPDHILASIIGPSVSIPFENGKLLLGTWQRVVLVELDGPRERELICTVTKNGGE